MAISHWDTPAVRYWERGNKGDELTDFIVDLGPIFEDQAADPAQIGDWFSAAQEVLPGLLWTDPSREQSNLQARNSPYLVINEYGEITKT